MKKIFTTLAVTVGICLGLSAQNIPYSNGVYFSPCQAATNSITPHIGAAPGLSPSDSALACGVVGTYLSDTIYFKNFTTSSGLTVQSLKIDSIYLPAGLCWSTNKASNTFQGGEDGVILVQGTPTAPQGQYKLRIIVDVNVGIVLSNQDAETLAHLRYSVRILSHAACPCPAINKTDTVDNYIAYTCTVGVNEIANNISNLSIVPNPFNGHATMTFSSEVEGAYTVKMTNLIGAVVSTKEVDIVTGENNIKIDRNNLSSGIYLVSISNGTSAVTRKVIIE